MRAHANQWLPTALAVIPYRLAQMCESVARTYINHKVGRLELLAEEHAQLLHDKLLHPLVEILKSTRRSNNLPTSVLRHGTSSLVRAHHPPRTHPQCLQTLL
jgi:hypothetical protein